MAETFGSVWRQAVLEMSAVPPLLVKAWLQEGYSRLCDLNGWAFLRTESALVTTAARDITAGVVFNSINITSAAAFTASDAGRQFRVGTNVPIYTIISVTDASNAVLDLPYTRDTDAAASAQILDAYATMPANFRRFLIIYDSYNQRTIPFWLSEDEIGIADPGRQFSDSALRYLVARKYSSATATVGRVQYEYWPAPTSARSYPYLYIRAAEELVPTDVLPGVLAQRSDALRLYAMIRCAMWPGTTDLKNPAFNLQAATLLKADWDKELQNLTLVDDSEYPQQYMKIHWDRLQGELALPASLLRQTDATINDYF